MRKLALFGILCLSVVGWTQPYNQERPSIEMIGEGKVEIVPDIILVEITLEERFDGKTKVTVGDQEKELFKILKQNGIDNSKLVVQDESADIQQIKRKPDEVMARKVFELNLSNAGQVGKFFNDLHSVSIDNAQIVRVDHSEMEKLKKQARIAAMKNAKEKSEYMLEAVGKKAGQLLYVREDQIFQPDMMVRGSRAKAGMYMMDAEVNQSEPALDFKKITVRSTVFLRYAVEN